MELNIFLRKIKTLKRIIFVISVLFVASMVAMFVLMHQKSETYTQNIQMKDELDELMTEYESIKKENTQFQSELSERDSIILANSEEIQKLINSQADYRKIRRQLELLRGITQDYVHRIDSLVIVNEELALENQEIKKDLTKAHEKYHELSKAKTEVDQKVEQASTLKAYNLRAFAMRVAGSKETETDKAVRADKIAVHFTLSENKIVKAGQLPVYVRIARPDGSIIMIGEGDEYSFELNGERLQFTMKKEINYENTAQNISLSWVRQTKNAEMKGRYAVTVFADNHEIGHTFFELK